MGYETYEACKIHALLHVSEMEHKADKRQRRRRSGGVSGQPRGSRKPLKNADSSA
jgi:hypothetical protein